MKMQNFVPKPVPHEREGECNKEDRNSYLSSCFFFGLLCRYGTLLKLRHTCRCTSSESLKVLLNLSWNFSIFFLIKITLWHEIRSSLTERPKNCCYCVFSFHMFVGKFVYKFFSLPLFKKGSKFIFDACAHEVSIA